MDEEEIFEDVIKGIFILCTMVIWLPALAALAFFRWISLKAV